MNKQIEEMAKTIYNLDHCEGYKDDRGCMYAPSCSVCKYGRENKAKQISELLAKQGYRKASEVADEIFAEIESKLTEEVKDILERINNITDPDAVDGLYEEVATLEDVLTLLAELKKKFMEDK